MPVLNSNTYQLICKHYDPFLSKKTKESVEQAVLPFCIDLD